MRLEHTFMVNAEVSKVWEGLTDLHSVAECFPGAKLNSVSGSTYFGEVGFKLGAITLGFEGRAEFLERDSSKRRAVIKAVGNERRGRGGAEAVVSVDVREAGTDTEVSIITDLDISGKPAQFGRGLLQDVSQRFLKQFVSCMESKLTKDMPAETGSSNPEASSNVIREHPRAQDAALREPRCTQQGLVLRASDLMHLAAFSLGAVFGVVVALICSRKLR